MDSYRQPYLPNVTPGLTLMAAVARDGTIAVDNKIPWTDYEDMLFFCQMTIGKAVIMGRKTYECIPKRYYNGRRVVVLSRASTYVSEIPKAVHNRPNMELAARDLKDPRGVVIGGSEVYAHAIPYVNYMLITQIDETYPFAKNKAVFPLFDETPFSITTFELPNGTKVKAYRRKTKEKRHAIETIT